MSPYPILEILPIILAIVAIITSARGFKEADTKIGKVGNLLGIICALTLIVAQSSWFTAMFILNQQDDTWIANTIWAVFNSMTMIMVIIFSKTRKCDGCKNYVPK